MSSFTHKKVMTHRYQSFLCDKSRFLCFSKDQFFKELQGIFDFVPKEFGHFDSFLFHVTGYSSHANFTLPILHCKYCFANFAILIQPCQLCHVNSTMSILLCQFCHANFAMLILPCQFYYANFAMPILLCQFCQVNFALPILQCHF